MREPAYLVVDFGTGGTKVGAFDAGGRLFHKSTTPVPFRFAGQSVDFDPVAVWGQVCVQMRSAVRAAAREGKRVAAVSSTSMREGNIFYDGEGAELLAVPNIDGRASKEAEELARKHGDLIYEKSGHWPMAAFLACRLKWLRGNSEETFKRVRRVSMINDWLNFRLSGVLVSEPSNGCETAAFDLASRDWSGEIAREVRLDEDLLPPVREGGTPLGGVREDASRATGLPRSALVVVGGADTESALVGCGAWKEGKVVAVAGTTTPVQAVMDSPKVDSQRRTWTCCHVIPGKWVVESNAGATGMVFDWWSRLTGQRYDALTAEAESIPPGSGGVVSKVGAIVFNARDLPKIHGEFTGVNPWTPRGAISRAIIEGTSYSVRANLEQIESVLGREFEELVFCGGGAESEFWSRVQAEVIDRRLTRQKGGFVTARGAMVLCRVATGESRRPDDFSGLDSEVIVPRRAAAAAYEGLFGNWLSGISD